MTITYYPPYVSFGEFQPLSRSLWILYRKLEDVDENQNNSLVQLKFHEEIICVIVELYTESVEWNISMAEFDFLIRQIRLKNEAVNPILFDGERHAYRNHIFNIFLNL